jgi:hypothetical protein
VRLATDSGVSDDADTKYMLRWETLDANYDRPREQADVPDSDLWLVKLRLESSGPAEVVYTNDFDGPVGSKYPEWTSSSIAYHSAADPPGKGTREPQVVVNGEAANGSRRFLGEFGGPKIGTADDPGYNRTQVDQTIRLTLHDLPPHAALRVSFDLLVLKSWDGNSPQYGPDRFRLAVAGGPVLLDTSFSNNHKVDRQGSYQDYPTVGSQPRAQAAARNTLGYEFFGDSTYPLEFTFPHSGGDVTLEFSSSLFEGKGEADESWGLDNLRVEATSVVAGNDASASPAAAASVP